MADLDEDLLKWYEQGMEDIPSESGVLPKDVYHAGYNKAIDDFTERLKPIIDEKIKGWTNSDDLRRWCERSIDEISEQLKVGGGNGTDNQ